MAFVYYHFRRRRGQYLHREQVVRDIDNPINYLDDDDIIAKNRMSRFVIFDLFSFDGDLKRPTLRSRSLSVSFQLMTALRFNATGSFQAVTAVIHSFESDQRCPCLVWLSRKHIKMHTQQLRIIKCYWRVS